MGLADLYNMHSAEEKIDYKSFLKGYEAYAFMVFNLFSAPCIGAISAMKSELNNRKSLLKAILFQTGLAWVLGSLIGTLGWLFTL